MNKSSGAQSGGLLLPMVYFVYFACGMAMCFEGAFNPEIKEYFKLSYSEQMLTFFAKNIPFIFFSVGIGIMSLRIGLKNCLTIALLLFAAGAFLLIPGIRLEKYWIVLSGFFLIGTGFNFLLVAGNPLLAGLGDPAGSSSRLNLGNALGAVAQIIAPLIISFVVPATVILVSDKIPYMTGMFSIIAIGLFAVGVFTLFIRDIRIFQEKDELSSGIQEGTHKGIWSHSTVFFGFTAIFFVLGTEAGIFGLYRNFLEDKDILGLSSQESQRWFTAYFAIYAAGRLVGSYIQKRIRPAITLIVSAFSALVLLPGVLFLKGYPAILAISATGFFISIFFPTIYSLSIQGLGKLTGKASGIITMGMLGAAIIPWFQGKMADQFTLQASFAIGFISNAIVLLFAFKMFKTNTLKK
jgi:FHS family L-fucose permease-like MFS transporter